MKKNTKLLVLIFLILVNSCSYFEDDNNTKNEEEKTGNLTNEQIEIYVNNASEKILNATTFFKSEKYEVTILNIEYIKSTEKYKAEIRIDWSNIFSSFYQTGILRFDEDACNSDWTVKNKSPNIPKLKCRTCLIGCIY